MSGERIYARESWRVIIREGQALLKKHYGEVAHYLDIPLAPDHTRYLQIESLGILRVYTVRDEDRKLIGYSVFFVQNNLHYSGSKQAVQDIIFIDPEKRGLGRAFIRYCDDELRAEGVQAVYHHVKKAHNFGPLLERDGYELIDLIYGKRLDK